jgi:hypothetical protein
MFLSIKRILPVCIACGCFFFAQKGFAFDYKQYDNEHSRLRSVSSPLTQVIGSGETHESEEKSSGLKDFMEQVLTAMQSDAVPVKIFDATETFSVYFKPAKISKLGIKYKF